MAKILFDLQISSYDKSGKEHVESDSNFIFTRNIIEGLSNKGHEVILAYGYGWSYPKLSGKNIEVIRTKYRDPVSDRYFMDYELLDKIKDLEIDFLWTNDPCRVGQYRVGFKGPILAYNHWIDNPIDAKTDPSVSYYFRQVEAAHKADFLGFNSEFGMDLFERGLDQTVFFNVNVKKKAFVLPPSLDTALLEGIYYNTPKQQKPTIIYNHRLSSAPQYDTATQRLSKILDKLDTYIGVDKYQVFFSNPSMKNHPILKRKNSVSIHKENYREYLEIVASGWVHLTLFSYPGQWSMAMAEAMCLGLPCVYPDHSGYSEMVEDHGLDDGFYRLDHQADTTVQHLLTVKSKYNRPWLIEKYSKEAAVNKVEALINASISRS